MSRYTITVRDNLFFSVEALDDEEDDEILGVEWAMIEINDALASIGRIDGEFTVANRDEAKELLEFIAAHIAKHIRAQTEAATARLGD